MGATRTLRFSRMRSRIACVVLLFSSVFWVALGGSAPAYAGDQIVGIGAPYWTHTQTFSTTAGFVVTSSSSSTPMLFPAGRGGQDQSKAVVVRAAGAARCAYTGAATASDIDPTCIVVDASGPAGTGPGACESLMVAGDRWDGKPNWQLMIDKNAAGHRASLCTRAIVAGGDTLYAPCLVDADCAAPMGGGYCTPVAQLRSYQRLHASMKMVCEADAATVAIHIKKEEAQRF